MPTIKKNQLSTEINTSLTKADNAEPAITKNTAFNKDFGTTAGTVLEGSKDAEYVKIAGAQTITGQKTFNTTQSINLLSNEKALNITANNNTNQQLLSVSCNNPGFVSEAFFFDISSASAAGYAAIFRHRGTGTALRADGFGTGDIFRCDNGSGNQFMIKNNGNVGIGTTTPGSKLDVDGDIKGDTEINTQTGTTYTLAIGDRSAIVEMNNASANTITIPTNASVAFPTGTTISIVQYGAGATTVTGDTGVTLNGTSGGSKATAGQYEGIALYKRGTNEWVAVNK